MSAEQPRRRESLDGMPEVDFGAFLGRNTRPAQYQPPKPTEPSKFTPPDPKPVIKNGKPAPVTGRMRQGAPRLGGLGLGGIAASESSPKKKRSANSSSTTSSSKSKSKGLPEKPAVERPFLSPEVRKPEARSGAFALDRQLPAVAKTAKASQDSSIPSPDLGPNFESDFTGWSAPDVQQQAEHDNDNAFGTLQQAILGSSGRMNEEELLNAYQSEDERSIYEEAEGGEDDEEGEEADAESAALPDVHEDLTAKLPLPPLRTDKSLPASPHIDSPNVAVGSVLRPEVIRDIEPTNDTTEEAIQQTTTIDTPEPSPELPSSSVDDILRQRAQSTHRFGVANAIAGSEAQDDRLNVSSDRPEYARSASPNSLRSNSSSGRPAPPRPSRRPVSPNPPTAGPQETAHIETPARQPPSAINSALLMQNRDVPSPHSISSVSSVSTDLSSVNSENLFFQQETPRGSISAQGGQSPANVTNASDPDIEREREAQAVPPPLARSPSQARGFVGLRMPSSLLGGASAIPDTSPVADLIASNESTRKADTDSQTRVPQADVEEDDSQIERPQSRFELRRQSMQQSRPASVKEELKSAPATAENAYPTPSPEPEDADARYADSPEEASSGASSSSSSVLPDVSSKSSSASAAERPEAPQREESGASIASNATDRTVTEDRSEGDGTGIGTAVAGAVVAGSLAVGALTWRSISAVASTGWSIGRAIAPHRVERQEDNLENFEDADEGAKSTIDRSESAQTITKVKAKVAGKEKTAVVPGQFLGDTTDDESGTARESDQGSDRDVMLDAEEMFKEDGKVVQGVETEWGEIEFPAPAGFVEALKKAMDEIGPEDHAQNEQMEIDAQEAAYRAALAAHEDAISSPQPGERQLSPVPNASPLPPSGVFPTTKKPARKEDKRRDREWRREAMLPPDDILERELGAPPSPDRSSVGARSSRYLAPPGLQPIEDGKATNQFMPSSPRPQPGKIRRTDSTASYGSARSSNSSKSSVSSFFGFGKSKRRDRESSIDSRSSILSDSSSSRRPLSINSVSSNDTKREKRRSLFASFGSTRDRPNVESEIGDATYVNYSTGRARRKSADAAMMAQEDSEELSGPKGILRPAGSFDPKRRRVNSIGLTGEIDENAKTIYSVRFANATQGLGLRSVAEDEAHRGGDETHALKWIGVGRGRYGNLELKVDESSDQLYAEQAAQIKKKWRAFGAEQRDWARVKID